MSECILSVLWLHHFLLPSKQSKIVFMCHGQLEILFFSFNPPIIQFIKIEHERAREGERERKEKLIAKIENVYNFQYEWKRDFNPHYLKAVRNTLWYLESKRFSKAILIKVKHTKIHLRSRTFTLLLLMFCI